MESNPPPTSEEVQNLPSPKTLSVALPSDPEPADDDPEGISLLSPSSSALTSSIAANPRRGPRRRKMEKRRAALEKTWQKNLETLSKSLKPIPFVPGNALDFASHENLLKRMGLWDFVHLQFDTTLRGDLICQLIANFSRENRVSYVNGVRIKVNRADLGRALRLPKKERVSSVDSSKILTESENDILFVEKLVSTWLLLHGDTWMMPDEVLNWMTLIKEGNIERVDWAGIIWFMVEKELLAKSVLEHCYYASHLQCLLRHQKRELLRDGLVMGAIDIDEDEDITVSEDAHSMDECGVELSFGDPNTLVNTEHMEEVEVESNVVKDADGETISVKEDNNVGNTHNEGMMQNVVIEEKEVACCHEEDVSTQNVKRDDEENVVIHKNATNDLEENDILFQKTDKNSNEGEGEEKVELLIGSSIDGCSLGRCTQGMMDCLNSEEAKMHHGFNGTDQVQVRLEVEVGKSEGGHNEDDSMEEEEEEEEEEDDEEGNENLESETAGLNIFSQRHAFDDGGSEDLLSPMEAVLGSYRSGLHMADTSETGHFLISGVESQRMPSGSLHYGTSNENKRGFGHLQSDFHQYSGNKKLKCDGTGWDDKPSSDINIWMDQMHQLMGKYKVMYDSKEHACQELIMNQQLCLTELQQRDAIIQRQKEDLQRKHLEVYRLENELYTMSNLVEGYRRALTGVQKSFSAYRTKYQLTQEPVYKDTGCGGLVVSKIELEKQRLRREEEERQTILDLVTKVKEFEARFVSCFEHYEDRIEPLRQKLCRLKEALSGGLASPVLDPKETVEPF